MSRARKAQQILETELLQELVDEYCQETYKQFERAAPGGDIAPLHAQAYAGKRMGDWIVRKLEGIAGGK